MVPFSLPAAFKIHRDRLKAQRWKCGPPNRRHLSSAGDVRWWIGKQGLFGLSAAAVFLARTFKSLRYRKEIIEPTRKQRGVYSMGPGHIVTTWSDKEICSVETFS